MHQWRILENWRKTNVCCIENVESMCEMMYTWYFSLVSSDGCTLWIRILLNGFTTFHSSFHFTFSILHHHFGRHHICLELSIHFYRQLSSHIYLWPFKCEQCDLYDSCTEWNCCGFDENIHTNILCAYLMNACACPLAFLFACAFLIYETLRHFSSVQILHLIHNAFTSFSKCIQMQSNSNCVFLVVHQSIYHAIFRL